MPTASACLPCLPLYKDHGIAAKAWLMAATTAIGVAAAAAAAAAGGGDAHAAAATGVWQQA